MFREVNSSSKKTVSFDDVTGQISKYIFATMFIIDVSFLCVWPAINHEFCYTIVKVAVDPRGDS